eukprot:11163137-Lingulodinium_polyedra.AAC.1
MSGTLCHWTRARLFGVCTRPLWSVPLSSGSWATQLGLSPATLSTEGCIRFCRGRCGKGMQLTTPARPDPPVVQPPASQ